MKELLRSIGIGFVYVVFIFVVLGIFIGILVLASMVSKLTFVVVAFLLFWAVAAAGVHLA